MGPLVAGDPRRLGDYLLAGRLGAGGQGVVYDAYDDAGRRVAIKVVRADLLEHPQLRARFAREVLAAGRVAPFCTARVIAAEMDGDQPYVVSEHIAGPTLQQAVEERGVYGPGELHRLATGIATALTAIHEAGVVHRDLKPHNVILGPDGPRVIDFGVARVEGATVTGDGRPIGTPAYMSPEQVNGEVAGQAADVWAWGGVVLFAATGSPPFGSGHATAVYHRVLTTKPDLSRLDEPLRELVSAAMARDPLRRPAARALLLRLVGGGDEAEPLLRAGVKAARDVLTPQVRADPSLGELAEDAYRRLGPGLRAHVPHILLRLVLPGDGADVALRRVPVADLRGGEVTEDVLESVLGAFRAAGLVLREGDTVTLVSAALMRAWPRMRGWVELTRDGLRVHGTLHEAARAWALNGRAPGDLYRGSALRAALHWQSGDRSSLLTLNPLERSFLDASATQERRRQRARRQVRAGVAVLAAALLAVAVIVVPRWQAEGRQRDVLAAKETARLAGLLRPTAPKEAMLLSVAAYRLAGQEPDAVAALRGALAQREIDVVAPPAPGGEVHVGLSANGRRLVVRDGVASVWDVAARGPAGEVRGLPRSITDAALSPDGGRLAVATRRSIRLWNVTTGRPDGPAFPNGALEVAFNGTGTALVAHAAEQTWQVWNLGGPLAAPMTATGLDLDGMSVSPDGRTAVALYENGRYRIETRDGPPPQALPAKGGAAAFSPDGRTLAVSDGTDVRFWDLAAGRWRAAVLGGAGALSVAYDPRGDHLATYDGTAVSLWTKGGRRLLRHPLGNVEGDVRFGPGGETLQCLLASGAVSVLDVGALTRPEPIVKRTRAAALSPDGRYAALQGATTELVEVSSGRTLKLLRRTPSLDAVLAFSADGRLLAGVTGTSRVTVWEVPGGSRVSTLDIGADQVAALAFRPSDGALAVAPITRTWRPLQLWNPRTGQRVGEVDHAGGPRLAFDPRGTSLAVGGVETSALLDLAGGHHLERPFGDGTDGVLAVAYGPGGRTVATGWTATGVDLWDSAERKVTRHLLPPAGADPDQFDVAAFSPDGQILAAGGFLGKVWMWRTEDGRLLGEPAPAHAGPVLALAFDPDGRMLHSLGADGALHHHPVDAGRAAAEVCRRAGGTLSPDRWAERIRGAAYRPVC
ncbi:WD40 repeat domain-containing serine/threonine protein kinase [Nonomuraea zeae]|nr:WD40 repeat domain-containing serine/threonine-protein kinase [Nonomuraea zeae]